MKTNPKGEAVTRENLSLREIFINYQRILSAEAKRAGRVLDKRPPHESLNAENMALILTLSQALNLHPAELGVSVYGEELLGPTTRTINILARLVIALLNEVLGLQPAET